MANLAQALKSEIQRLARKELRQALDPLRKHVTQQRKEITALKKALQSTQKHRPEQIENAEASGDTRLRFTAKGLKSNRARLGLSAESMASLLDVSAASIYNWEVGKTIPRRNQLPAIAELRVLGKREVQRRLEAQQPRGDS